MFVECTGGDSSPLALEEFSHRSDCLAQLPTYDVQSKTFLEKRLPSKAPGINAPSQSPFPRILSVTRKLIELWLVSFFSEHKKLLSLGDTFRTLQKGPP